MTIHSPVHHLAPAQRAARGFTLVELMVTVAIVGIVAAVAIPAFTDSVRKSRRADAFTTLAGLQQVQERWRGSNPSYQAANTATPPAEPNGMVLGDTPAGYYSLALDNVTATTYDLTATAKSGTSQASDGSCVRLRVRAAGGNLIYGSAAATGDFDEASNNRCWAR